MRRQGSFIEGINSVGVHLIFALGLSNEPGPPHLAVFGAYTLAVVANHGIGFLQVFFGDLAAMGWPGQINLDFLIYVMLAALWIAWRHDFTAAGIVLGLFALFGAVVLLPYLLWATANARGDVRVLLLGRRRASGTPG